MGAVRFRSEPMGFLHAWGTVHAEGRAFVASLINTFLGPGPASKISCLLVCVGPGQIVSDTPCHELVTLNGKPVECGRGVVVQLAFGDNRSPYVNSTAAFPARRRNDTTFSDVQPIPISDGTIGRMK